MWHRKELEELIGFRLYIVTGSFKEYLLDNHGEILQPHYTPECPNGDGYFILHEGDKDQKLMDMVAVARRTKGEWRVQWKQAQKAFADDPFLIGIAWNVMNYMQYSLDQLEQNGYTDARAIMISAVSSVMQ